MYSYYKILAGFLVFGQYIPIVYFIEVFFFLFFRATPAAYGGSQARGQIRAAATGLHHSHSHAGSELHL